MDLCSCWRPGLLGLLVFAGERWPAWRGDGRAGWLGVRVGLLDGPSRPAWWASGQCPGPVYAGQPGVDQGAQVDGRATVVQPGAVLAGAQVAQPDPVPAAGGGPGDDALDHRPGPVGLLEFRRPGLGAGGAQQ